ncbi:hypothetical protein DSL72_006863 [Monilinia vaccinii-corymbosi]|uniref:RRM domain-containing protein n=1 Tax=Monilinia vaccinii-corymbosi TaxID=61207 RepID=A0A8A3PLD1_9HELO|nr:hypothetical protein DSL72_006863 [Monilinia vaccinii-corymbosi]
MDFIEGRPWYDDLKYPVSTEASSAKRRSRGREGSGAQLSPSLLSNVESKVTTKNPAPARFLSTHVQRLESIASQAEEDQDEENKHSKQARLSSTKPVQGSNSEDQKLHKTFPMRITFEEAMKSYSPPTKRSRWADMFESRLFDRTRTTPPGFFSSSSRKASPHSPLDNKVRRLSPAKSSDAIFSSDIVTKSNSPPKKTSASDDSKRFRAFLARSDNATPFFMSPTGTHQQFFHTGPSHHPGPSIISRGSNNSHPRNTSHPLLHSRSCNNVSLARGSLNSSRGSRSMNTNMDTSRTSSTGGTMWSLMDGSSESISQLTDHTQMSSNRSVLYHPAIPEATQILHGVSMMGPEPAQMNFSQTFLPEIRVSSENTLNHDMMALAITPPSPPVPMVMAPPLMAMNSMLHPPPDLSHLVNQFRPTNMLLRERGMIPDNSRQDTNYEGDDNHPDLLGLPDSVNCCMWIINIPPDVGHGEFMRILDCGAVAALSLVEPQGTHKTQAAKATFKKVAGGAELFRRARRGQGLRIGRHKIKVWYNDYGAYEWRGPETRFLEIEAPAVLDEHFWQDYFSSWCKYIVISIASLPCSRFGFALTRFEFVRIAGQAQTCFQAIQKDKLFLGQVKVQYGLDPFDI